MKRIVLSLSILLLAATESHALRSGSTATLSVQNGSATIGCSTASGSTGTEALLVDPDGTGSTVSTCKKVPYCANGEVLKFDATNGFTCVSAGGGVGPLIVTQSQTPIAYDAGATTMYMGFGGAVRNLSWSLTRLTNTTITFKNLYCQTHDVPSGGQATVTLVYTSTYGGATTATNLSVVLSQAGTNTTAPIDIDTTASIPANAYIGYKIDTTSGFTSGATYSEPGVEIYCTVERAS